MSRLPRSRVRRLLWLAVLVALGLGSRRSGMPEFSVLYVGDVLWGALFFTLYAACWLGASALRLWWSALATTEFIEISELYRAPWLEHVRETALGGLLLGHTFL